jgi:hypothetical protein
MALSEKQILKIKVEFEAGKLSRSAIGKRYKVSQPTIRKLAEQGNWAYGKNFKKVSEAVELKSIEKLIGKEVDKTTKINDDLLANITFVENIAKAYLHELAMNKKNKEKQTKEDADRIFSFLKPLKIASETFNMNYSNKRKAFGMDREDELKRSAPYVDPTEGLTESDIDAKLADFQ